MNKKLLMSTIVLLVLSLMIISPVKAITKEPYWAHVEIDVLDLPDKQWFVGFNDGIMHIKDWHWSGPYEGTLGTGTFDVWFEHLRLNMDTGEGTYSGKWRITIPGQGTLAGSARGKITGYFFASGKFAGADGTGDFEGVKKMGSYTLDMTSIPYMFDALGTIIYP